MASVVIVRHAERLDDSAQVADSERSACAYPYALDCPLSVQGHAQAFETGVFLNQRLGTSEVVLYSSPYLRCLQTGVGILKGMGVEAPHTVWVDEGLSE